MHANLARKVYDLIFYGEYDENRISSIVGYLMPNPFYTYISNIYDLLTHFVDHIFEWASAHFLHTVKGFQVLLCNSKNLTSVIRLHPFK